MRTMDSCLISVPYLLDTAKQDGGRCLGLRLQRRVLPLNKHKLEHERNNNFCSACACTYACVASVLTTVMLRLVLVFVPL